MHYCPEGDGKKYPLKDKKNPRVLTYIIVFEYKGTHCCIEDLVVANGGPEIPADVKGHIFITRRLITSN